MRMEVTADEIERWRIESQLPGGNLAEVTIGEIEICESMGCYSGADIHSHLTARWENGAKRREPIPLSADEQRAWLLAHRPDLYPDWRRGEGWAHREL